jgi:hypothetical protein
MKPDRLRPLITGNAHDVSYNALLDWSHTEEFAALSCWLAAQDWMDESEVFISGWRSGFEAALKAFSDGSIQVEPVRAESLN